ncbi:hypothetical protein DSO57_1030309 [Entomophthora muscae]|uniref:Uncharacterized protein n=1 Tax=Entomophthora muscae TaxID=34485 RepID=A0ACC2TC32_9FUNG|nr:hypothetical protein DSO57_1030309 [Entomophthora muscae]
MVFSLASFLLLLWSISPDLWGKISSSAQLVGKDPSSLWNLPSGLLFSGEAVVKSLTCDDLHLDIVDHTLLASEGDVISMPLLLILAKSYLVPLEAPEVFPPTPTCTPWLLTRLMLMGLNAYFPQLSPASSLWSPLQVAIPVLHWMASWWFALLGWEPNLVSLAPSLTRSFFTPALLPADSCPPGVSFGPVYFTEYPLKPEYKEYTPGKILRLYPLAHIKSATRYKRQGP